MSKQEISITDKINNTYILFEIINNEKEVYNNRRKITFNNRVNKRSLLALENAHCHYNKIFELINGFFTLKYDIELFNKTYITDKDYEKSILLMSKIDNMLYSLSEFSCLCE